VNVAGAALRYLLKQRGVFFQPLEFRQRGAVEVAENEFRLVGKGQPHILEGPAVFQFCRFHISPDPRAC